LLVEVYAFHAGTTVKDGKTVTAGGRVIAVCAYAKTLREAVDNAYEGVKQISFEGMTFRKDIAYQFVPLAPVFHPKSGMDS
jgi:phosphoribosylamine--glycine ligase/phosphoribosylformylglycinamidine cyclo-ligase